MYSIQEVTIKKDITKLLFAKSMYPSNAAAPKSLCIEYWTFLLNLKTVESKTT